MEKELQETLYQVVEFLDNLLDAEDVPVKWGGVVLTSELREEIDRIQTRLEPFTPEY